MVPGVSSQSFQCSNPHKPTFLRSWTPIHIAGLSSRPFIRTIFFCLGSVLLLLLLLLLCVFVCMLVVLRDTTLYFSDSFTHSLTHWLTDWLTHSLQHMFIICQNVSQQTNGSIAWACARKASVGRRNRCRFVRLLLLRFCLFRHAHINHLDTTGVIQSGAPVINEKSLEAKTHSPPDSTHCCLGAQLFFVVFSLLFSWAYNLIVWFILDACMFASRDLPLFVWLIFNWSSTCKYWMCW